MMSAKNNLILQLSNGYRAARRTNSVLCLLSIAWSTAQLNLKTLNIGFLGNVDFSQALIPLILFIVIAYTTMRFSLEFVMQCIEVRKWGFAQIDFKISVYLVFFAMLSLAASGLYRSVKTPVYIFIGIISIIIVSFFVMFLTTMALMPLISCIRRRQGRLSVASAALESMTWADIIVACFVSTMLVVLGVASYSYTPLRSLWISPPNSFAIGFFVFICIVVFVSFYFRQIWFKKIFATSPKLIAKKVLSNGTVQEEYKYNTQTVWDWSSQFGKNKDSV